FRTQGCIEKKLDPVIHRSAQAGSVIAFNRVAMVQLSINRLGLDGAAGCARNEISQYQHAEQKMSNRIMNRSVQNRSTAYGQLARPRGPGEIILRALKQRQAFYRMNIANRTGVD